MIKKIKNNIHCTYLKKSQQRQVFNEHNNFCVANIKYNYSYNIIKYFLSYYKKVLILLFLNSTYKTDKNQY